MGQSMIYYKGFGPYTGSKEWKNEEKDNLFAGGHAL